MNTWKRTFLILLVFILILSLVLSACGGSGGKENGKGKDKNKEDKTGNADKITICHKTGSAKNPYKEITVANDAAADGHVSHAGDIIPAPAGGCPTK